MLHVTGRIVFLFVILMSLLILVPIFADSGIDGFIEDDTLEDDDDLFLISIPIAWTRIPVHQLSILLRLGISIFALFVVYLGGRSKHRRFNDRTIDANTVLRDVYFQLKTARARAVFNFLYPLFSGTNNPIITAIPIFKP